MDARGLLGGAQQVRFRRQAASSMDLEADAGTFLYIARDAGGGSDNGDGENGTLGPDGLDLDISV